MIQVDRVRSLEMMFMSGLYAVMGLAVASLIIPVVGVRPYLTVGVVVLVLALARSSMVCVRLGPDRIGVPYFFGPMRWIQAAEIERVTPGRLPGIGTYPLGRAVLVLRSGRKIGMTASHCTGFGFPPSDHPSTASIRKEQQLRSFFESNGVTFDVSIGELIEHRPWARAADRERHAGEA